MRWVCGWWHLLHVWGQGGGGQEWVEDWKSIYCLLGSGDQFCMIPEAVWKPAYTWNTCLHTLFIKGTYTQSCPLPLQTCNISPERGVSTASNVRPLTTSWKFTDCMLLLHCTTLFARSISHKWVNGPLRLSKLFTEEMQFPSLLILATNKSGCRLCTWHGF